MAARAKKSPENLDEKHLAEKSAWKSAGKLSGKKSVKKSDEKIPKKSEKKSAEKVSGKKSPKKSATKSGNSRVEKSGENFQNFSEKKTAGKSGILGELGADFAPKSREDFQDFIQFQGVRTHNLKNVDLAVPKNALTVVTGVSGSGKSSFAFETLYKEGQFRYIESLSSYLRQFFQLGERADIDWASGLSPAIAIEQNKKHQTSRSTVGTLTELDDFLRLLLAKLGDIYCFASGQPIKAQSIDDIVDQIFAEYAGEKIYLLKELGGIKEVEKFQKFVRKNRRDVEKSVGFTRFLVQGENVEGENILLEFFYLEEARIPKDFFPVKIFGVFDRVTIEDAKKDRLREDLIRILNEAKKFGVIAGKTIDAGGPPAGEAAVRRFTDKNYSPDADLSYPDFSPQHFSPNRQEGACSHCHGIGELLQVDVEKIVDAQAPLLDAVLPWKDSAYGQAILKKLAQKYSVNENTLWKELPERFLQVVVNGDGELLRVPMGGKFVSLHYHGIEGVLKEQYAKGLLTVDFQSMLEMTDCPHCFGEKLKLESLHVFLTVADAGLKKNERKFLEKIAKFSTEARETPDRKLARPVDDGLWKVNIADLWSARLEDLLEFVRIFREKSLKPNLLVERISKPLMDRLGMICDLGLNYLELHRTVGSLSGGETQRLRLAKQLGNQLTGITYVLDEPTIGLSDREIVKTIRAIKELQKMGNTIVVVEHHHEFIEAADRVIEIGPGAGDFGGELVFSGPVGEFLEAKTLTADFVTGKKKIACEFSHTPSDKTLKVRKASKFTLQNVDADIPLGSFTIITGPSGAGKTTLMYEILYKFFAEKEKFVQGFIRLKLLKEGRSRQDILTAPVMKKQDYAHRENLAVQAFYDELRVDTILGVDEVDHVVYVDQSSIGKTPRSCPATFIGTFDAIREMFAGTSQAKYLGFGAGHFSFNSAKGACPACRGYGYKKIELQFLPDTYVECELCQGQRYKKEILAITRHGKNISEVLKMYVDEAVEFFGEIDHIRQDLALMQEIGLGYLRLGQPAHTLSGGESQRLKLIKNLLKSFRGHTLYFLDEPTVGLHDADIEKLLRVFKKFVDQGDTILMIEHDKNLLQFADLVIELDEGKLVDTRPGTRAGGTQ